MKRALICAFAAACLAPQFASAAQPGALGLSRHQLEDADLIDATGHEIGEVDGVVTDASGAITSLVIELHHADQEPDKRVLLPLRELRAVPEPGEAGHYDIQTRRSAAEVMKLPPASTTSRGRPR